MPAVNTSGSQTATISTEHTLATVTAAKTLQLVVDVANMVNGDELELRIYSKARSTDTERRLYFATFSNIQSLELLASLAVVSPHYAKFTLKQTAGTGRAFPWAVNEL